MDGLPIIHHGIVKQLFCQDTLQKSILTLNILPSYFFHIILIGETVWMILLQKNGLRHQNINCVRAKLSVHYHPLAPTSLQGSAISSGAISRVLLYNAEPHGRPGLRFQNNLNVPGMPIMLACGKAGVGGSCHDKTLSKYLSYSLPTYIHTYILYIHVCICVCVRITKQIS